MNIPHEAIEKAIEGGWKSDLYTDEQWEKIKHLFSVSGIPDMAVLALDSSFWQSLGKALGWEEPELELAGLMPTWMKLAKQFYHIILSQQDTQPFWEELLTPHEIKRDV